MITKERHGHTTGGWSPTYRSWMSMKNRCNDPKNPRYRNYGGGGVQICARWSLFSNFLLDMGERPAGTTLGRFGDQGDYEPQNCQWQTPAEQAKKGSSNGRAKLTEEQVLCIRALCQPRSRRGVSVKNMAADLGVSFGTVDEIVRRKTWRHI